LLLVYFYDYFLQDESFEEVFYNHNLVKIFLITLIGIFLILVTFELVELIDTLCNFISNKFIYTIKNFLDTILNKTRSPTPRAPSPRPPSPKAPTPRPPSPKSSHDH
jgi:hypothetical protein